MFTRNVLSNQAEKKGKLTSARLKLCRKLQKSRHYFTAYILENVRAVYILLVSWSNHCLTQRFVFMTLPRWFIMMEPSLHLWNIYNFTSSVLLWPKDTWNETANNLLVHWVRKQPWILMHLPFFTESEAVGLLDVELKSKTQCTVHGWVYVDSTEYSTDCLQVTSQNYRRPYRRTDVIK